MIIYFVRHGHPDYKTDSLTELGKLQAEGAAQRLKNCGISEIYASSNGRAMETAQFTADILGLPVVPCDFMRELSWGSKSGEEIPFNGKPWDVANSLSVQGIDLSNPDWGQIYPFSKSKVVDNAASVRAGFDGLMAQLGYTRDGQGYRVTGPDTDKNIAIFSHAGSASAVMAHLLNITFPQMCLNFHMDFASITKVSFPNDLGARIFPKFIGFNDAEHIQGIAAENVFGN